MEQVYETNENTVRLIQIDDLRNDDNIKYCERKEEYIFANKNDVIIAWDGANAGTIGYGLEGAIGSTLAILRTDSNNIFIPYIGRFLQSKSKYLRDTCTGATIPHISKKALEEIKISDTFVRKTDRNIKNTRQSPRTHRQTKSSN